MIMCKVNLQFYLSESGFYRYAQPDKYVTSQEHIIGGMLTSSIVSYSEDFKRWVLNNLTNKTAGNITFLDKEGDYIILRDRYSEEPEQGPEVYIPKSEMLRLLDWWEQVWKHKPAQAHLIFDGEVFSFDPNYDNSATGSFLTIC
jgi:hypothetical protein